MFRARMRTFAPGSGTPWSDVTRPVIFACANRMPGDSANAAAIANGRSELRGRSTGLIGPLTREKCPPADRKSHAQHPDRECWYADLQTAPRRAETTSFLGPAALPFEAPGRREVAARPGARHTSERFVTAKRVGPFDVVIRRYSKGVHRSRKNPSGKKRAPVGEKRRFLGQTVRSAAKVGIR